MKVKEGALYTTYICKFFTANYIKIKFFVYNKDKKKTQ